MTALAMLLYAAEEEEEKVNITPVLLKFIGKFFLIFAVIAVVAILTPRMAKKVDEIRAKQSAGPEDPRCKAVRGPYDLPPLPDDEKENDTEPEETEEPEEPEKPAYIPKH